MRVSRNETSCLAVQLHAAIKLQNDLIQLDKVTGAPHMSNWSITMKSFPHIVYYSRMTFRFKYLGARVRYCLRCRATKMLIADRDDVWSFNGSHAERISLPTSTKYLCNENDFQGWYLYEQRSNKLMTRKFSFKQFRFDLWMAPKQTLIVRITAFRCH